MSLEVIGEPSSHTAFGLIFRVTVKGFPLLRPPLSRVGSSTSTGEAMKFPFRSRTAASGRTCWSTDHQVHVADAQLVIGFVHSGHCSAPKTTWPPSFAAGAAVDVAPPPADLLLLQAAATTRRTPARAMVLPSKRNLIPFPPFSKPSPSGRPG